MRLANRHGLITGATGSGKTVKLQGLVEGFSDQDVPVFCADIKSDLSGLAEPGQSSPRLEEHAKEIGFKNEFRGYPVIFWEIFGEQGAPIRATVSEMGPLLLSRLMDLSEAQEGVLNIAFKIADDEKLPLLDLKDLQALLEDLVARADTLTTKYGNITKASVGSIQRSLLVLGATGRRAFLRRRSYRSAHRTGSRPMPRKATTRPPRRGIRQRLSQQWILDDVWQANHQVGRAGGDANGGAGDQGRSGRRH
jgi:uncharacterized protein